MRLRVREIAEARGLDAAKLSRAADLGYGTVYGIWTNPTANTNTKTLKKIADVLNVSVADLIEEDGPKAVALAA